MIWLNPLALFALAAVAAPILIHILIQRRAERFPFPTLRFLQPTRLAAIRRHLLEDLPLLAVRAALFAAAAIAVAGPLMLTPARRDAWNRRVVRAVITEGVGAELARPAPEAEQAPPLRQETFAGRPLADGIRRAILWLDKAPPGRREMVIVSPFPIGSISSADLDAIPPDVGVQFERTGSLPAARTVPGGRLLTAEGVRARELTFAADRTSVRDTATGDSMVWPIDVVSSLADKASIDAAAAAVLSQRVWAAPPDRRARVLVVESPVSQGLSPAILDGLTGVSTITQPWMAHAAARIARDASLAAAAARVPKGLAGARFTAAPWRTLASAADGRPLAAAAASADRFVVASAAPASDIATPVLLRAMANAIAPIPDLQSAEVMPIADTVLRGWSRPSMPMTVPRINTVEQDDRRWLWFVVLCLLVFEIYLRRTPAEHRREQGEEHARVA